MIRGIFLWLCAVLTAGAAMERGPQPVRLSPAEGAKAGQALVAKILSQTPAQSFSNSGTLRIRDSKGRRSALPIQFQTVIPGGTSWDATYETLIETNVVHLLVRHQADSTNRYHLRDDTTAQCGWLEASRTMTPFAGSDFWFVDLGLEFLHWPEQRVIQKEVRNSRSCNVLESVNPHPVPGAYSKVVSWIDIETDGIINADAYDDRGRVLKQFAAKSFKKIEGEWELKEIEMLNRQTGSRTLIEFNLGSK